MTGDRSPLISIVFIFIFNATFNIGARKYFIIIFFLSILVIFLSVVFSPVLQHRYVSEINRMLNIKDKSFDRSIAVANSYIEDHKSYIKLLNNNNHEEVLKSLNNIIDRKTKLMVFDNEYKESVNLKKLLIENRIDEFIDNVNFKIEKYVKEKNTFLNLEKKLEIIKLEQNSLVKLYRLILNTHWGRHYSVAFEIFQDNKFFGKGVKSFRYICPEYDKEYVKEFGSRCSLHPHNIGFEILSETGLTGLFLFILPILNLLLKARNTKQKKTFFESFSQVLLLSVLLSFLIPFKPTGSIFSSWYGATFWFVYSSTYFLYLKK